MLDLDAKDGSIPLYELGHGNYHITFANMKTRTCTARFLELYAASSEAECFSMQYSKLAHRLFSPIVHRRDS